MALTVSNCGKRTNLMKFLLKAVIVGVIAFILLLSYYGLKDACISSYCNTIVMSQGCRC